MVGADLAGVLARRTKARQVKAANGTTSAAALFFHHNGKPIVDVRKAWHSACKKAGVPNLLWHDLRRSAVKNMDEAGISRDVARSITGHKTDSIYSRYNIVTTTRQRDAARQLQHYREAATGAGNVVSISK